MTLAAVTEIPRAVVRSAMLELKKPSLTSAEVDEALVIVVVTSVLPDTTVTPMDWVGTSRATSKRTV